MTKWTIWSRGMVAVLAVIAVVLVAGGTAFASNTGFKLNMPLALGGAGNVGLNWISLPYFNPYTSAEDFCTQTGIGVPFTTRILTIDLDGNPQPCICGSCGAKILQAGEGVQVRPSDPASPASIIIVGSHNPSLPLTVPQADLPGRTSVQDNFRYAVPYHTTATTGDQLCAQIGLVSPASIQVLDPVSGSPDTTVCGFSPGALVLGRSIRIRNPAAPITFVPAHF